MSAIDHRLTTAPVQTGSTVDREDVVPGALPLVLKLFHLFNDEKIRYCHWKSNLGLPAAMRGETDLDLLVDSRDAHRLREILGRHSCKPVVSDPSRHFPGLEDWIGLDPEEGRFIHLHVHYRLVLGEQLVKNHTLPLEGAYLDSTTQRYGMNVPVPELELIVLVLRALLKYRNRDLLRDLLGRGRSGIPPAIFREIADLRSRTSDERIAETLRQQASVITPELIFDFFRTIDANPRTGWKLCWLRRRARAVLAPFQRHRWLRARAIYYRRMIAREVPLRRLLAPFSPIVRKRKTPVTGGLTVAIVGVDGAGKSTVVRETTKSLSWRLVAQSYYLGNSKTSLTRLGTRIAGRIARLSMPGPMRYLAERGQAFMHDLQSLTDARGRYRQYRAGRKAAAGGAVVIFDRFPLEAIQIDGHAMDGPRIAQRHGGSDLGFLARRLAQAEQSYYDKFLLPDLLIILQISAEIAVARKPDHSPQKIAEKCQSILAIKREGLPLLEIDASRPLADVLREVKAEIWRCL